MSRLYATVNIGGHEVLSYKATPGFVMSVMTIPWQVCNDIGRLIFGVDVDAYGSVSGPAETTIVREHVFMKTATFRIILGKQLGPNHWTFVPSDGAQMSDEIEWVQISDYSDVE
jgi:hypothetical protein